MTSSFAGGASKLGYDMLQDILRTTGGKVDPGTASIVNQLIRSQGDDAARMAAQAATKGIGRKALFGGLGTAVGLGANVAAPILGELIAGNIGSSRDPQLQGTGSKFMIGPGEQANFMNSIFKENQNRRILNSILPEDQQLDLLDPEAEFQKAVDRVNMQAAQAGERERALQFGLQNIAEEGQSQRQAMMGLGTAGQTAGKVLEEAISRVLTDPGAQDQTILVEVGRAV
jgi:hypothetical protein